LFKDHAHAHHFPVDLGLPAAHW